MNDIKEQIRKLRGLAEGYARCQLWNVADNFREAANTIETLSVKLQSANMELSTAYYNGGWIPCSERIPEENEEVMLTFENSAGLHVGEAEYRKNVFFYVAETDSGYYEEVYKNPVAWMPKPEPYKPQ